MRNNNNKTLSSYIYLVPLCGKQVKHLWRKLRVAFGEKEGHCSANGIPICPSGDFR